MSLLITDLEHLGQSALQEFGQEVSHQNEGADRNLERQAQRLEAKLEQLYAVTATMAQRETSLEGVTGIWAKMVVICETMAKALSDFHQGHPLDSDSYDRMLDIRNVCEENRALHA